jgi:hypothetical protein
MTVKNNAKTSIVIIIRFIIRNLHKFYFRLRGFRLIIHPDFHKDKRKGIIAAAIFCRRGNSQKAGAKNKCRQSRRGENGSQQLHGRRQLGALGAVPPWAVMVVDMTGTQNYKNRREQQPADQNGAKGQSGEFFY